MEYGRVRAEKYGRRAKFGMFIKVLVMLALVLGILWAAGGPLG